MLIGNTMARKPKLNGYFVNTLAKLGGNATNVYNSVVANSVPKRSALYFWLSGCVTHPP